MLSGLYQRKEKAEWVEIESASEKVSVAVTENTC